MSNNTSQSRVIIGLIIIAVGATLLLRNLNIFAPLNYLHFLFSWKIVLIIVGIILFFISGNRSSGIILIVIGGVFLLPDIFGVSYYNVWRMGLPAFFILIGLLILLRKNNYTGKFNKEEKEHCLDYIDEITVFGGLNKNINTKAFKGGKVTTIFGGLEINLLGSDLAEGQNMLDLLTIFGGTTFYVPDNWNLKIDVISIFGGFSDTRSPGRLVVQEPARELIIKGIVIFGGGEIKTLK